MPRRGLRPKGIGISPEEGDLSGPSGSLLREEEEEPEGSSEGKRLISLLLR